MSRTIPNPNPDDLDPDDRIARALGMTDEPRPAEPRARREYVAPLIEEIRQTVQRAGGAGSGYGTRPRGVKPDPALEDLEVDREAQDNRHAGLEPLDDLEPF